MKRRNVLASMGAITAGGSALVGAGAYTRVEAQRGVTVEVVGDEEAYLGLRYRDLDVECGDVVTFVTITNQLKRPVSIDEVGFDDVDDVALSEPWFVRCGNDAAFEATDKLEVGECVQVRVEILDCPVDPVSVEVPFDVEVSDDDVLVVAQGSGERSVGITCECPRETGVSFVAFCGDVDGDDIADLEIVFDEDGRDEGVRWELDGDSTAAIEGVVLFGGFGEFTAQEDYNQLFLNYEYESGMTEATIDRTDEANLGSNLLVKRYPQGGTDPETGQHPSCPCRDDRDDEAAEWLDTLGGVKFEVDDRGRIDATDGEAFTCR